MSRLGSERADLGQSVSDTRQRNSMLQVRKEAVGLQSVVKWLVRTALLVVNGGWLR